MVSPLASPGTRLLDPADIDALSRWKLNTLNQTVGTIPAAVITGGGAVVVLQTNATPGTQTTRTALQLFGDDPTSTIGGGYLLRISNSGAGTLTLAGGTNVTVTGTATVATTTFRDFVVIYGGTLAVPTVTITNIGTGTYS